MLSFWKTLKLRINNVFGIYIYVRGGDEMRQTQGKKREGGRREWEWEWEWQRISTMQGMCRTCCTFHAASLSLLSHMPSFFLSFSIYKTSLPFGSIFLPSFLSQSHVPPHVPSSFSLFQSGLFAGPHPTFTCALSGGHISYIPPFEITILPLCVFFISILLFLPLWLKLFC